MQRQDLLSLAKELRQVAVAVSIVGTRRAKLLQLAAKARPFLDELTWVRPEARKLRSALARALHNMERGQVGGRQAKNLRAVADVLDGIAKLIGASPIPVVFQSGQYRVTNVWGYTTRELMPVTRRLGEVIGKLDKAGLGGITGVEVIANPDMSKGYATYSVNEDVIYVNPGKAGKAQEDLLRAFGDRLWVRVFESRDKETWGRGTSGWEKFTKGWVAALDGRGPDPDTAARLTVTVGRLAGPEKWEKAVA